MSKQTKADGNATPTEITERGRLMKDDKDRD